MKFKKGDLLIPRRESFSGPAANLKARVVKYEEDELFVHWSDDIYTFSMSYLDDDFELAEEYIIDKVLLKYSDVDE